MPSGARAESTACCLRLRHPSVTLVSGHKEVRRFERSLRRASGRGDAALLLAKKERRFRVNRPQIFRVDRLKSKAHDSCCGRGRQTATRTMIGTMSDRNVGQPADWSGTEQNPTIEGLAGNRLGAFIEAMAI